MFDRQFFEGKLQPAVKEFAAKHCKKEASPSVEVLLRDGATYHIKKVIKAGERLLFLLVYSEKARVSEITVPYGEIVRLNFVETPPRPEARYELTNP